MTNLVQNTINTIKTLVLTRDDVNYDSVIGEHGVTREDYILHNALRQIAISNGVSATNLEAVKDAINNIASESGVVLTVSIDTMFDVEVCVHDAELTAHINNLI
jgi:hypothetical protein